jgi:hypothetical protein
LPDSDSHKDLQGIPDKALGLFKMFASPKTTAFVKAFFYFLHLEENVFLQILFQSSHQSVN